MKLTTLTILCSCFLLLASLVNGENKSIDKDKFMRINPNITNEALRAELENLGKEFDIERQRVRNFYDKKMEILKSHFNYKNNREMQRSFYKVIDSSPVRRP